MKALRRLHHDQAGFTIVEMIVTMALVTFVTGGMVSGFAIFDRVQAAWRDRTQARAVSTVAEEAIVRDARVYQVAKSPNSTLVLQAPSDGGGSTFTVTYTVDKSAGGLVRTVTAANQQVSRAVVAHGITDMTATCGGHPGVVHVLLSVAVVGGRPNDVVPDTPGFDVSPRNPGGSECS